MTVTGITLISQEAFARPRAEGWHDLTWVLKRTILATVWLDSRRGRGEAGRPVRASVGVQPQDKGSSDQGIVLEVVRWGQILLLWWKALFVDILGVGCEEKRGERRRSDFLPEQRERLCYHQLRWGGLWVEQVWGKNEWLTTSHWRGI